MIHQEDVYWIDLGQPLGSEPAYGSVRSMSNISTEALEQKIEAGEEVIDRYVDSTTARVGTPRPMTSRRRQDLVSTNLPVDLTDASRLIVQTCPTGDGIAKQPNEFIITGRGGLPPTPSEAVNRDAIQVDLVTADAGDRPFVSSQAEPDPKPSPLSPKDSIVEAQGWQVSADGTVFLVAAAPHSAIVPSLNRLIHCR